MKKTQQTEEAVDATSEADEVNYGTVKVIETEDGPRITREIPRDADESVIDIFKDVCEHMIELCVKHYKKHELLEICKLKHIKYNDKDTKRILTIRYFVDVKDIIVGDAQ